eukprot:3692578-Pleurochrysis_carterae.AAC.3
MPSPRRPCSCDGPDSPGYGRQKLSHAAGNVVRHSELEQTETRTPPLASQERAAHTWVRGSTHVGSAPTEMKSGCVRARPSAMKKLKSTSSRQRAKMATTKRVELTIQRAQVQTQDGHA